MTFGHFLLGSHNFMVKALDSCLKWPLIGHSLYSQVWYMARLLVIIYAIEDGWMMKQTSFQSYYKMIDCQWWLCVMLSGECEDDRDIRFICTCAIG